VFFVDYYKIPQLKKISKNYGAVFPYFGEKNNQDLGKIHQNSSAESSF
jgi:hypothetical protein